MSTIIFNPYLGGRRRVREIGGCAEKRTGERNRRRVTTKAGGGPDNSWYLRTATMLRFKCRRKKDERIGREVPTKSKAANRRCWQGGEDETAKKPGKNRGKITITSSCHRGKKEEGRDYLGQGKREESRTGAEEWRI